MDPSEPLGETLEDALATLDKRYALVNQGGKTVVARRPDPDYVADEVLECWGLPAFHTFHANHVYYVERETADGTKTVPLVASKEWIKRTKRYSRVTFSPDPLPSGVNDYNLWDAFQPPAGDPSVGCEKIKVFFRDIICDGRAGLYHWLIMWLAHAVQRPGTKPGTALVIQGDGGSGKSTFGELIHDIWGKFSVHASNPDHVTGKFNKHQSTAIMIVSDEAIYAGTPGVSSIIKDMVTGRKQRVEPKGIDSFEVRSCSRSIYIGNPDKVIPIEANGSDRRFLCMSVSNARGGDKEYFADIRDEAESGGLSALYNELMAFDPAEHGLTWTDVREAPVTPERLKMRGLSLRAAARWAVSVIEDGYIEAREENGRTVRYVLNEHEPTLIEKAHMRLALQRAADRRDSRDDANSVLEELFGKGTIKDARRTVCFNVIIDGEPDRDSGGSVELYEKPKAYCYVFPPLATLRKILAEKFGAFAEVPDAGGD